METINKKVSGTTVVKLQSASINIGENPAMTICNINTADCNLNLYYSKENYDVTYTAANAAVTITDFTELNPGDTVNLIATDGTNYDFVNGSQSSVNGTWESTTSNDATATNLMNVINTASGPSGTRFTAITQGAVVTITQAIQGINGNTTASITDSNTAGMVLTSSFTGGADNGNVTTDIYYILKSFTIPSNKTLSLDKADFAFNNLGFDMYAQLDAAIDDVDIIINY